MGQNGRAVALGCGSAAVAVAGTVLVLLPGQPPLVAATSVLRSAVDVTVVRADGSTTAGRSGLALRRGDEVVTGRRGWAQVVTRDRTDDLPARSSLVVTDGVHQALRRGSVVVDAVAGDGAALTVAGDTVTVPAGAAARINGTSGVGVGTLAGAATLANSAGARVRVPALAQVQAAGDAVPTVTTPLRLTDDRAEAAAAPGLVRDDQLLRGLAAGIDRTGSAVAVTAETSWQTPATVRATHGTSRSERVLPVVLARAAGQVGAAQQGARPPGTAYDDAVRWRSEGGSWGVIARLLGVAAASAADELAVLQHLTPGGLGRVTAAGFAAGAPAGHGRGAAPAGPAGGGGVAATGSRGSAGGSPGGSSTGGPGGGSGGPGRRTPSPAPSPSPVTSTVRHARGVVDRTVHRVVKRLPSTLPVPVPSVSIRVHLP